MDNESNTKVTIKIEPPEQQVCKVIEIESTCTNLCEDIKIEIIENEVPLFYNDVNLKEKFENQRNSCVNTIKKVSENAKRKLDITEDFTQTIETDNKLLKIRQTLPATNLNIEKTSGSDELRNDLFHYCEICKVKYLSEKSLRLHMNLHDESRKFKCNTCGYRYKSRTELTNHMMKHSDTKFECNTCGYSSKWKGHFNQHMKQKHGDIVLDDKTTNDILESSQQYPTVHNTDNSQSQNKDGGNSLYHQCNICDYRSFVKLALDRHMKLHDLKRRYQCNVCLYRFSTKQDLSRHMSKHSDMKYSCRVCGRQYKYEEYVIKHMHVHRGVQYRCDVCGHVCDAKQQLAKHMAQKHNNIYQCKVCLKMFKDISNLTHHMKLHL